MHLGHKPIQTQGSVPFKLHIWKITQEIKTQVISSQIPYLLIGMDHAKHFQLQIDAKKAILNKIIKFYH